VDESPGKCLEMGRLEVCCEFARLDLASHTYDANVDTKF